MTIDKGTDVTGSPEGAASSPIAFRLEPGSGVPTYLQLVHQVEQALRLGHLTEGDQLPTVKETVAALAINPNTVLKAYRELEHRGLAEGKPGQGTFICGTLRRAGLAEQEALRTGLLGWLRSADDAGLDADGMTALFTAAMRDFLDRLDRPGEPGRVRRGSRRAGRVA
jgi:GntR family transcriptional regulator